MMIGRICDVYATLTSMENLAFLGIKMNIGGFHRGVPLHWMKLDLLSLYSQSFFGGTQTT